MVKCKYPHIAIHKLIMSELIKANDANEDKINYIIGNLPIELVKLIYVDYVNPDVICRKLYIILYSIESACFKSTPLENFLRKCVFQNDVVIKYLIKNDTIFQQIYKTHIIDGIKEFKRFPDIISSFAMSWIRWVHH